jgi:hypothetical protein
MLTLFALVLSLDNLTFPFQYLRAHAFVTVLMVVDLRPPLVSLQVIHRTNYLSAELVNA